MSFVDDFTFGCYLPGDSFLHWLDARVKLVVLALLVMISFAASRAVQLGVLAAIALGGLALGYIPLRRWWRGIWALRWLLLCTLLLHTLLTPGHTMGGIAIILREQKLVIAGDTLFAGGVGRTDLPGGNSRILRESLTKLFNLPADFTVITGHGELTTIGREKDFRGIL